MPRRSPIRPPSPLPARRMRLGLGQSPAYRLCPGAGRRRCGSRPAASVCIPRPSRSSWPLPCRRLGSWCWRPCPASRPSCLRYSPLGRAMAVPPGSSPAARRSTGAPGHRLAAPCRDPQRPARRARSRAIRRSSLQQERLPSRGVVPYDASPVCAPACLLAVPMLAWGQAQVINGNRVHAGWVNYGIDGGHRHGLYADV